TTSLPASAAAGGTVEVGPDSGWASGGAARNQAAESATAKTSEAGRMASDLDRTSTIAVQPRGASPGLFLLLLLLIMILLLILVCCVAAGKDHEHEQDQEHER